MRRRVQQMFVRCAQATSASETHAQDPPIPNPKLGFLLFIKLVFVFKTFINFFKAFVILTNNYILFNLINHIFIVNKQLKDKHIKAIKDN
jgi:hypothetical protein